MARILSACILLLLFTSTLGLGFANLKKISLVDIERDNLKSKQNQQDQKSQQTQQPQQQQQQPKQQQQQKQQNQAPQQSQTQQQPQGQQQQQPPSAPEYTGQPEQPQLSFEQEQHQLLLQHLQGYQSAQPFFHTGFLGGNNLGFSHDFASFFTPQHSAPSYPQQFYFPQGGYSGLQFLSAPSPVFYNQHTPTQQSQISIGQSQIPTEHSEIPIGQSHLSVEQSQIPAEQPQIPAEQPQSPIGREVHAEQSELQQSSAQALPQNTVKETASVAVGQRSSQSTKQAQPQKQADASLQPQVPAQQNLEYTQSYNPIPKELESYTTIPDSVYQGKEPSFLYDQQIPAVSLTNEDFGPFNTLYQQSPQVQRPVFSSGVKADTNFKDFPSSATFFSRNSFFSQPGRQYPSESISYNTYRQGGPSPF